LLYCYIAVLLHTAETVMNFFYETEKLFQKWNLKMAAKEIDGFNQKLRNLWQTGLDAHLDIDTHGGQAWVGLRVRLGVSPGPHDEVHQAEQSATRTQDSPRQFEAAKAIQKAVVTDSGIVSSENDADQEKSESESIEISYEKVEEAIVLEENEKVKIMMRKLKKLLF
jgi:hypothetical protein